MSLDTQAMLVDQIQELRKALSEALSWAEAPPATTPPDSRCELLPALTRRCGVDRLGRLRVLRVILGYDVPSHEREP